MRLLPLLFDPRGTIDRRAFWSGMIQLTLISAAVYAGLMSVDRRLAWAALPATGEAFVTTGVAGWILFGVLPDVSLVAGLFLVTARLYATMCLVLKRWRDADGGLRAPVAFGLAMLLVHVATGVSIHDLFPKAVPVIVPLAANAVVNALIGAVFVVWIGAQPARAGVLTVAEKGVRCAG